MTMLFAWLVFLLVLGVLASEAGCSWRKSGGSVFPGALILPSGAAVIIVVAQLATASDEPPSLPSHW